MDDHERRTRGLLLGELAHERAKTLMPPRIAKTPARSALEGLISGAPKFEVRTVGLQLYLTTCTPELAAAILESCNVDNRKVRQQKIREFAAYMKRGDWLVKSMLEFLESGRLHDGQHRLLACVESGVTIPLLVQVMPDAKSSLSNQFTDIGAVRTLADFLHFEGVYEAYRTAPFLVFEKNARISAGNPFQSATYERKLYLDLYQEIGEERIKRAYDCVPKLLHRKANVQRAFLDWFAFQVAAVDHEAATLFLQYVHQPEQLKRSDPMFVLHERLMSMAADSRQQRAIVSTAEQAVLFIKAWNLHYEHQPATVHKLRYRVNDDFPLIKGVRLAS